MANKRMAYLATFSRKEYDKFLEDFAKGHLAPRTLGKAFYDQFRLSKIENQAALHNLWAKDGDHARRSIETLFDFKRVPP